MNGTTIEISIDLPTGHCDELIGMLSLKGFDSFWEDGSLLKAYLPEDRWTDETTAAFHVTLASFAASHDIPLPHVESKAISPQNWNALWEESIQPIQASERIIIAPSWRKVSPSSDQIIVVIDPKMSFGTGHHETTRLMLRLLEPRIRPDSTVLDVGTGTGILAIAALKLGARSATGVDIDEWSFDNARENAIANGLAGQFTIVQGELADVAPGQYSLVAANIQRSIIEPLLAKLKSRTTEGGRLLLSGLLDMERNRMLTAFKTHALTVEEELHEQEWIAFALRAQ